MRCLDMLRESVRWRLVGMAVPIVLGAATFTVADSSSSPAESSVDIHGDPLPEGAIARLGTVRYRAGGPGSFLADNRTLLSSGRHLTWLDITTGRITRSIGVGDGRATLLAVTRDRSVAAVGGYRARTAEQHWQYQIVFVDTTTGKESSRLVMRASGPYGDPSCAAFTPDGTRLATGHLAGKGVVRIWNVATGRVEAARTTPAFEKVRRATNEGVESVAFSSDGTWLVAASSHEAIRWRWQSDEPMERMGRGRLQTAQFAPNSGMVAVAGPPLTSSAGRGPAVQLFDVETNRQVLELDAPKGEALSFGQMAFTADGSRLVIPFSAGGLGVWNLQNGDLERMLPWEHLGLRIWPRSAGLSPDGRWAAAVWGQLIAVWDFKTGQRVDEERVGHMWQVGTLLVCPAGRQVLTVDGEGLAVLWETHSGRPVHVWRTPRDKPAPVHGSSFLAGAFSPDGDWVATSARNEVVLRNRTSGEVAHAWPGHQVTHGCAVLRFAQDSRTLLSFGDDWFLRAFDVRTGQRAWQHAIRPTGVALKEKPDGSVEPEIVRMGGMSGYAPSPMMAASFTPDGQTLVLLSRARVHLFDVHSGEERTHYGVGQESRQRIRAVTDDEHAEWADDQAAELNRHIAIAPDSRRLATVGVRAATKDAREYELHIRRLEDGEVLVSFPLAGEPKDGYSYPGTAMEFSPDGTKLAVASPSGRAGSRIDLYDVATGRLEARIERDDSLWLHLPGSLAFTPDGDRIVAAQADTTALVWDWRRFSIANE
jgi:WD40 repeat protein